MQIQTKFSLREKVFYVKQDRLQITVACTLCNDSKKVAIAGEEFICPKCGGGHASRYRLRWFVDGPSLIGKLTFEHEIKMGNCNYDSDESETESRSAEKTTIHYMLAATGIGSGSCWNEEFLFATREEAQAYCDMKNNEVVANERALELPSAKE